MLPRLIIWEICLKEFPGCAKNSYSKNSDKGSHFAGERIFDAFNNDITSFILSECQAPWEP